MDLRAKGAAIIAGLALVLTPALADGADGVSKAEAKKIAKAECNQFKDNFVRHSDFGQCVAAGVKAVKSGTNPAKTCAGLSKKKAEGQKKSDYSACVKAAAHAKKEAKDNTDDPEDPA